MNKPKYEIGQTVWHEERGELESMRITCISLDDTSKNYSYSNDYEGYFIKESNLHPSKDAICDAMIAYWDSKR